MHKVKEKTGLPIDPEAIKIEASEDRTPDKTSGSGPTESNSQDDDNIIPYQPSPTLTAEQAVMYILGYRGEYSFMADTELMEFELSDYLYNLQEEADCAFSKAGYELEMLKRNGDASPDAIKIAEKKVASAKAELEKANKLPAVAENYRLLINHEISRVRLGKRSPLVIDEGESARADQLRINKASFLEWLEGMELEDATEDSAPIKLPLVDDALDREMDLTRNTAESLFLTLGLLVSLYAESSGGEFGSGLKPKIINIAEKIDKHGKQLNKDKQLYGQGTQSVRKRIEVALSTLNSTAYSTLSFK